MQEQQQRWRGRRTLALGALRSTCVGHRTVLTATPPLTPPPHVADWAAVAASGVVFVSIKATEGVDYTDPFLAANWAGAREHGIVRTAYHFAHPSVDALAQANHFVDAVGAAGGIIAGDNSTMQLMLDLEDADGLGPGAVWSWVQAFMGQLQARTGRPGIVYTGYYFWRDAVGNPT